MKRKRKDPGLDEIIRMLVRACRRIEKASGGTVRWTMEFSPKPRDDPKSEAQS